MSANETAQKEAVTGDTVRRVARLARIGVEEQQLEPMARELSAIIAWVEELAALDTKEVPPMTSVVAATLPTRQDAVTDGECSDDILRNAPERIDGFFVVPRVVE